MFLKIINCRPESYIDDQNRFLALRNLITSHGTRKNIVILDVDSINHIKESSSYDKTTKNFVYEMDYSRREYSRKTNDLEIYFIVDFDFEGLRRLENESNIVIKISYKYFVEARNTDYINLITESRRDYEFYKFIGKYYAENFYKGNFEIKFTFRQGAGSQIKEMFDELTADNQLTLCIVDNDKPHPNKGIGSTARLFSNTDKTPNNNSLTHIIDVREIESLIPFSILSKVLMEHKKPSEIDNLDRIKKLCISKPEFRKYFDHKEGLSLKEAIALDELYGPFWLDLLAYDSIFNKSSCFSNRVCYECKGCKKINGLGENILKRSLVYLENTNLRALELDKNLITYWNKLGKMIVAWGCTPVSRKARSS